MVIGWRSKRAVELWPFGRGEMKKTQKSVKLKEVSRKSFKADNYIRFSFLREISLLS